MTPMIGTAINRTDGWAKVTGSAPYAADHALTGVVYGYLVTAAIAHGRIKAINTEAATQAPGTLAVFTAENAPPIVPPSNNFIQSKIYEARLPLADDRIHYAGQIIGLAIADTFERARDAANRVQVEYEAQPPLVELAQATFTPAPSMFGQSMDFRQGTEDWDRVMAQAAVASTTHYTTANELHAPMEPHAIMAHWTATDALTIYEPSQWVMGSQRTYGELFGLSPEKVRIITPYIGGAFGCKAFPWPHSVLAAAAARVINRPVKLVVSRRQMTANTGHRSATEQTIQLAAERDGTLLAIGHGAKSATSPVDVFTEPCTGITAAMYRAPNLLLHQELGVLNVGTPTFMRAPGENPGMWALESAMDELAWQLTLDPVDLRLKNLTQAHQRWGLPFSQKHFAECLRTGAAQFGWGDRPPQPRSLRREGQLVGWGMAGSTFPAMRGAASVKVQLLADGSVQVFTAGNDMGTGAYTVVAATTADALQVPIETVRVAMGDSRFPDAGIAGGSQMTASLTPAVMQACQDLLATANCATVAQACDVLQQSGQDAFEATATTAAGAEGKQWAFQSWGAHFCEVVVDEAMGRLRVSRWVAVMDVGRVINAKAAASQVRGGIIMGMGHALMEECNFDPVGGSPVVYDLATYHVPTQADVPRIEVTFVGKPDLNFNPAGARGVGEIGITGVSAAIANALYHATGRRVRSLPITPDKLIGV
ncbi:MAG: xanthine dehydrogenase family protein molybdopterin-binding subunit [Leptolyngbyaceae bacterium]|nr:xanthine dehydrogenase family protein molybdopterin-binding subunit [Leptolyngbyaceae bacterium]